MKFVCMPLISALRKQRQEGPTLVSKTKGALEEEFLSCLLAFACTCVHIHPPTHEHLDSLRRKKGMGGGQREGERAEGGREGRGRKKKGGERE